MGAASALTGTEGISRERSRFSRECRAELREQDGGGGDSRQVEHLCTIARPC